MSKTFSAKKIILRVSAKFFAAIFVGEYPYAFLNKAKELTNALQKKFDHFDYYLTKIKGNKILYLENAVFTFLSPSKKIRHEHLRLESSSEKVIDQWDNVQITSLAWKNVK